MEIRRLGIWENALHFSLLPKESALLQQLGVHIMFPYSVLCDLYLLTFAEYIVFTYTWSFNTSKGLEFVDLISVKLNTGLPFRKLRDEKN